MRSRPSKSALAKFIRAVPLQFIFPFTLACCILVRIAAAQPIAEQQETTPGLHPRSQSGTTDTEVQGKQSSSAQPSTLPTDVSGTYEFDHLNESIEVDVDRHKLSGYISRLGDAETDTNTPLTYFFDHASVQGPLLQFQTRVVHGVWYSFRGTIVRGRGEVRNDEGYYVLHGVLQEHHPQDAQEKSADETIVRRTVNFKSMAQ